MSEATPDIETFTVKMFGVYAGEGFGCDGPIAMFKHEGDARSFIEFMGCDCVVIPTDVSGSFDNSGDDPKAVPRD